MNNYKREKQGKDRQSKRMTERTNKREIHTNKAKETGKQSEGEKQNSGSKEK